MHDELVVAVVPVVLVGLVVLGAPGLRDEPAVPVVPVVLVVLGAPGMPGELVVLVVAVVPCAPGTCA